MCLAHLHHSGFGAEVSKWCSFGPFWEKKMKAASYVTFTNISTEDSRCGAEVHVISQWRTRMGVDFIKGWAGGCLHGEQLCCQATRVLVCC